MTEEERKIGKETIIALSNAGAMLAFKSGLSQEEAMESLAKLGEFINDMCKAYDMSDDEYESEMAIIIEKTWSGGESNDA